MEPATPAKKRKSHSTVETLPITCPACAVVCSQERVYWNHFPSKDALFLCPECIQSYGKIYPIKTTLIIAPATICHQWYEELKRHISADVKIDMYRGVLYDGYKHPEYLATQDIVVCSFETLRSEINFMGARPRRDSLRQQKRFRLAPTPLVAVEWWRVGSLFLYFINKICVDEAQMVESTSSVVATMCEELHALLKTITDLYGLLRFLHVEPYSNECWWRNDLMAEYWRGNSEPLKRIFSKLMWRNTKETVADQVLYFF
ncbi:unnamed protein product [Gongylonema pulchrum]|uniref:SNF2 N-terminal domain-containing protein n=1 Tax=Gongylonema pulchrum TaxID=637853 RepID=A0A3P7N6J2_9BILA|nr:unnamed protein product [Gongylonema pulchrum]